MDILTEIFVFALIIGGALALILSLVWLLRGEQIQESNLPLLWGLSEKDTPLGQWYLGSWRVGEQVSRSIEEGRKRDLIFSTQKVDMLDREHQETEGSF